MLPAKNNQEEEERRFLEISLNRSFPSQQRHIVVDTYENSAREEEGGEKREKARGEGGRVFPRLHLYQLQRLHYIEKLAYPRPIIPVVGAESYMRCIWDRMDEWEGQPRRELWSSNNSEIKTELKSVLDVYLCQARGRQGRGAIRCRRIEVTRATNEKQPNK